MKPIPTSKHIDNFIHTFHRILVILISDNDKHFVKTKVPNIDTDRAIKYSLTQESILTTPSATKRSLLSCIICQGTKPIFLNNSGLIKHIALAHSSSSFFEKEISKRYPKDMENVTRIVTMSQDL